MSKREGPCTNGQRHRWWDRASPIDGKPYWWCGHCGKTTERNPR